MGQQRRVAIVTGGTEGIGWSVAKELHSSGYSIVISARSASRLKERQDELEIFRPNQCAVLAVDHTTNNAAEDIVCTALERFGRLDVLVNNVGGGQAALQGAGLTRTDLMRELEVNLAPAVATSLAAIAPMQSARYGRIVTIGSLAGRSRSLLSGPGYAAAKAAVHSWTRHLAVEMAPFGITVNTVAPGYIATERVRMKASNMDDDRRERLMGGIPMGRAGTPAEVAAAVSFLVSEGASYVTGAILDVNGGVYLP